MIKKSPLKIAFLLLLIGFAAHTAGALTLEEYLQQVKGQSSGYKAQEALSSSAQLRGREADLVFSPSLFAEGRTGYDAKLSSPPSLVFDKLESTNYKLGVSQQFFMGLQAKLYYDVSRTNFAGANFGPNVATQYWDASPKVELTLPLLGGGFGRTTQANQELIRQQSLAESFSAANQANNFLIGAEAAYWKLSAWNDVVRIQDQALKAAQNILNYVTKKQNMNLGERSDVIQARALVEGRTLELQVAKNEARDALRNFNKLRNAPADQAAEALQVVDVKSLESLAVPSARPGDRMDVKATEAQLNSAKASSRLVTERNRATLDVYGNYALNGRESEMNKAL
ncbi:MAG: TolC family protein, partial [Proteobacteria bacterium]